MKTLLIILGIILISECTKRVIYLDKNNKMIRYEMPKNEIPLEFVIIPSKE